MGFFRILLRILTFGILGKERSPEEIYVREKLAREKEQKEELTRKRLEQQRKKLEQRRAQLLKTKK